MNLSDFRDVKHNLFSFLNFKHVFKCQSNLFQWAKLQSERKSLEIAHSKKKKKKKKKSVSWNTQDSKGEGFQKDICGCILAN